jgi:hypothetical protein
MPERDDRRGRRATVRIDANVMPRFAVETAAHDDSERGTATLAACGVPAIAAKLLARWRRLVTGSPLETESKQEASEFEAAVARQTEWADDELAVPVATPFELAPAEPADSAGDCPIAAAIVKRAERVVPITRRRLRRAAAVAWHTESSPGEALARIYLQGDAEERIDALRRLLATAYPEGPGVFRDALRNGNDAERVIAVDGLERHGRRDDLVPALHDRVEPIAAKAALAYAATRSRETLIRRLEGQVPPARLEAIIGLLVGLGA